VDEAKIQRLISIDFQKGVHVVKKNVKTAGV
jgi:hypothetical protein